MDKGIIAALISLGGLVVFNILIQVYQYGRLSQKVDDFCKRVERLEKIADRRIE